MDILISNLSKRFENKVIFRDLNITFLEGRINCLMGASGIGKTTLVNLILGLIRPDSGRIEGLEGKQVAAVFQEDRLIEHWNALKNVKLVCGKTVLTQQIEQEFLKVGISDCQEKPVLHYSGGMRRRVAIVRALLSDSKLILLDEPFKGMDEELKKQIIEYVKERTKGKTVIIVTHDTEDVALLEANLITIK